MLNGMKASEEIAEDQSRQASYKSLLNCSANPAHPLRSSFSTLTLRTLNFSEVWVVGRRIRGHSSTFWFLTKSFGHWRGVRTYAYSNISLCECISNFLEVQLWLTCGRYHSCYKRQFLICTSYPGTRLWFSSEFRGECHCSRGPKHLLFLREIIKSRPLLSQHTSTLGWMQSNPFFVSYKPSLGLYYVNRRKRNDAQSASHCYVSNL